MPRKSQRKMAREEMDWALENLGQVAVLDRLVEQLFEAHSHYQVSDHQRYLNVADSLEGMLPQIAEHLGVECEELAQIAITHLRMG